MRQVTEIATAREPEVNADKARRRGLDVPDLVLALAGVAFGSVSLAYPYGRDQGLYHYIGREWSHGRLPFRDAFDVKTPGIYLVHALCVTLFGERSIWPIRAAELACIVGIGVLVAMLADPRRELRGGRGLGVFAASVSYYGYFDFWDTGQCEIWCVFFCAGALVAAHRKQALLAGLLVGVSALFKPPSLIFGVFAAALLLSGSLKTSLLRLVQLSIAAVVPLGIMLAYFRARGAWAELYDVLVVNNRHYVVQGRWVHSVGEFVQALPNRFRSDGPLSVLLVNANLVLAWISLRRGDRASFAKHAGVLLAFAAVVVAVGAQLKFCNYHWGLWVGPAAFSAVATACLLRQHLRIRHPAFVGAAAITGAFLLSGWGPSQWLREQRAFVALVSGNRSSDAYHEAFAIPQFSWRDSVAFAEAIDRHAAPGDEVVVRGFEPQIYVLTGRRYSGRFFWSTFLVVPEWSYRIDDWRNEDKANFAARPPRFVLAIEGEGVDSVDSVETYEKLGYTRVADVPRTSAHVLLERR